MAGGQNRNDRATNKATTSPKTIRHTESIGLSGNAYQVERMVIGFIIGLASINKRATDKGIPLSISALNKGMIAQSQIGKAKPLTIAAP